MLLLPAKLAKSVYEQKQEDEVNKGDKLIKIQPK